MKTADLLMTAGRSTMTRTPAIEEAVLHQIKKHPETRNIVKVSIETLS